MYSEKEIILAVVLLQKKILFNIKSESSVTDNFMILLSC